MSSTAASLVAGVRPGERVEVLFEELAELAGQRNAIDGRVVQIVAELDRDELCGATGARSVAGLVAWKLGASSGNAHTIATVAHRLEEFPRCVEGLREGRLSLGHRGRSLRGTASKLKPIGKSGDSFAPFALQPDREDHGGRPNRRCRQGATRRTPQRPHQRPGLTGG
jgi:Domain of unknown function (DUF222)